MASSVTKANEIIRLIEQGDSLDSIKTNVSKSEFEWFRFSNKAYNLSLAKERKYRKGIEHKKHVSAASNDQILDIISLNEKLGDYALSMHISSTNGELRAIMDLVDSLPATEKPVIDIVGKVTMGPKWRALQKKGRIEQFDHFKVFSKLVDAAILSYYRTNFISCYLTLIPVIEGIIIRWMGYNENDQKPDFKKVRKFFKQSAQRQPCPENILFHNVFVKACDKILNNHLYKPTSSGNSWANFNRHVASHLLTDSHFGTKENCIRLFILLDSMTEIFLYESRIVDPRFSLSPDEIDRDLTLFANAIIDNVQESSEQLMFGTSVSDVLV